MKKYADGGMVKKGPDLGGVMSEAGKGDDGFKKGGKLKTGGIAAGKAPAPRLDRAPRGPRPAMKRGGSAFSAAHEMNKAPEKGNECD
jgi:hypothetical protein